MRKYVTVKFNSREELEEFLAKLSKGLDLRRISLDVRGLKAVVGVSGDDVEELKHKVLALANFVKSKRGGRTRGIPLDLLAEELELRAPFPFDLAQYVLNLLGYEAKVRGRRVLTNADVELVKRVLNELSQAYEKMEGLNLTAPAKRLVAIYSVVKGRGVDESVEDLKGLGLLNEGEVISLAKDYYTAVRTLEKLLRSTPRV